MTQQVVEQVAGVLYRNGVPFDTRADGDEYRIVVDSAATFVSFTEVGGHTVISIRSPLLQDIAESTNQAEMLELLNQWNGDSRFGRYVYYPEVRAIVLEYDLLGDDLQESELLNAVSLISRVANTRDEELKLRLGSGLRYRETPDAEEPDLDAT